MDSSENFFLTVFLSSLIVGVLMFMIPLEVNDDISEAKEIVVQDSRLFYFTQCFELGMQVSDQQAQEIETALIRYNEDLETERPLMPEVTSDIMNLYGLELERAEINSIENQSYRADLVFTSGDRVDARPSDAVLLAAESDIPVYLSNELLRDQGKNTCLDGSQMI